MIRNLICLIFVLKLTAAFSGEKTISYRKIFLNEDLECTDSITAAYFAYGLFAGNHEVTDIQEIGWRVSSGDFQWNFYGPMGSEGKAVPMNGTLFVKKYGMEVYEFESGYLKAYTYFEKQGNDTVLWQFRDYESRYQNQPGTYYFEKYNDVDTAFGYFRNGDHGWREYCEYDSGSFENSDSKYPYWTGHVPKFIGVVGGIEGFRNGGYEIGIAANIFEIGGDVFGNMGGFIFTYKNRFDNSYYSLNAEVGAYLPWTFAMGYNYHSNGTDDKHTFKLTTGITLFHLQMLYSYNFFRNSKNPIPELFHHTFTLRYALPVWRISN